MRIIEYDNEAVDGTFSAVLTERVRRGTANPSIGVVQRGNQGIHDSRLSKSGENSRHRLSNGGRGIYQGRQERSDAREAAHLL
jgi:hypothetical protein